MENRVKSLKLHLNGEDNLVDEMKNVFIEHTLVNPLEDIAGSFMTYRYEPNLEFTLPMLKERINHHVDLAKNFKFDHKLNSNMHNRIKSVDGRSKSILSILLGKSFDEPQETVKHQFGTHDYFEPVLVDTKSRMPTKEQGLEHGSLRKKYI